MKSIGSVNSVCLPPVPAASSGPVGGGSVSFKNVLLDSIQQVNMAQLDASRAVENLMNGGKTNPAQVLTAVQKADVAFRMMMQIRNKLVQAYEEVKDVKI